jgi:hypothetical protein
MPDTTIDEHHVHSFSDGDRVRVVVNGTWTSAPSQRFGGLEGRVIQRLSRKAAEEPAELGEFIDVLFVDGETGDVALPATFPVHVDAGTVLTFHISSLELVRRGDTVV